MEPCLLYTSHLILRWHGEKDPISLRQYAQIPNLYGIVTSLYHLPLGQVWDRAEVLRLKEQIEAHGLKFELVDSFRIHEDIKRGYASRDALIENYRKNIRMLAECGIRIICYNFMPVFDLSLIHIFLTFYSMVCGVHGIRLEEINSIDDFTIFNFIKLF